MAYPQFISRLEQTYRDYPPQFWTLVLVTFIDRLGGFLLYPFFGLYVTERFGVGMATAGWMFAAFSVSSFIGHAIGGGLIDHFGRRKMIIFSLIASSTSSVVIGLITSFNGVLIMAALMGILTMAGGPAYDAMTADLLPEEKRPRGFSIMRIVLNLAAAIGPAVGGMLAARSYMTLFITDAAVSLVAAIFVFATILETRPAPHPDEPPGDLKGTFRGYGNVLRDRLFILLLGIGILRDISYINMNTTLGVFLRDVHGVPEEHYGLLLTLNAAMIILLQYWITRKTEAKPPARLLAAGALLYAIGFGLFGITSAYIFFVLSIVIISLAEMISAPREQALVAQFAPEEMRGRYMALQGIAWGIPLTFGPLMAGLVMDSLNPNLLWYIVGAAAAVAAVGYLGLQRMLDRRSSSQPG